MTYRFYGDFLVSIESRGDGYVFVIRCGDQGTNMPLRTPEIAKGLARRGLREMLTQALRVLDEEEDR